MGLSRIFLVLPSFIGFYQFFAVLNGVYWVLPSFHRFK